MTESGGAAAGLDPAAGVRAVLINAAGSFTAAGESLTGPVDSPTKFGQLLDWFIGSRGGLNPLGGPGQAWVVGAAACQGLGWWPAQITEADSRLSAEALQEFLAAVVASLAGTGWELLGAREAKKPEKLSPQLLLVKHVTISKDAAGRKVNRRERRMVQLVLEPFAEYITGRSEIGLCEDLPEDDEAATGELGRRIVWLTQQLGVLPAVPAATTGQRLADVLYKSSQANGGAVPQGPGVLPGLDIGPGDEGAGAVGPGELEPAAHWGRPRIDAAEIPDECDLVLLDQQAAYLATAGSIELGFGEITHLSSAAEIAALLAPAWNDEQEGKKPKWPFGVFLAVLPAGERLAQLPTNLPLPHPLQAYGHDVTAWITGESVKGMLAPVQQGGAGLSLDDLAITEAYVFADTRRFLDDWTGRLRTARAAAIADGDDACKRYLGAIYKQYVGRLGTDKWAPSKMVHYQPIWRASIIAHCRWRARRQAMTISAQQQAAAQQVSAPSPWQAQVAAHGLWPIYTYTDSWRYLLPTGMTLAPTVAQVAALIAAGDKPPRLGALVEEDRSPLTSAQRELLLASQSGEQVSQVVYGRAGIPAEPLQQGPRPAREDGKGPRRRIYVGNRRGELEAAVSPAAVADLENLVAAGQFSYLPDGITHISHTADRKPKPVPDQVSEVAVPEPQSAVLVPVWRRPVVIYTTVVVATLLIIAAVVIALAI